MFSEDWRVVVPEDCPEWIRGLGNWFNQSESLKLGLNRKFGVVVVGGLSKVRVLLVSLLLLLPWLPLPLPLLEPPLALPVGVDIVEPAALQTITKKKTLLNKTLSFYYQNVLYNCMITLRFLFTILKTKNYW